MFFTNRIAAEFDRHTDTIGRVANDMRTLREVEVKDRQAFNGGCRDFESIEELDYNYKQARKEVMRKGDDALQVMQGNFDQLLDEAFAIDPAKVEALTNGVLKLGNLSDRDLMIVAKKNRNDYSTLMAIADYSTDHESKYASGVSQALKKYIEVATDSTKRIIGSCRKGMKGDSNFPSAWRGMCDGYINDVQTADDCLQAAIDGREVTFARIDPLMAALGAASR